MCASVRVCVCVCVCSQASGSQAMLSWDSSYFNYWQSTIQASYAVIRQLLLMLFYYLKEGSCQLLAIECAHSTDKLTGYHGK